MVRPIQIIDESGSFSAIPLAIGLFVSVSLLVGLCAKHARQMGRRRAAALPSPKQLLASISQKAKRASAAADSGEEGGGGVWQKAILMGEKCQPPEFSGVIYYDYDGKRISEMPKSPRHGAMTPLKNISFPAKQNEPSLY